MQEVGVLAVPIGYLAFLYRAIKIQAPDPWATPYRELLYRYTM